MRPRLGWAVVASVLVLAACGGGDDGEPATATDRLAAGEEAYQANCALCHGEDLRGTEQGPPFLSAIYLADHHPDASFVAAVEEGVQPHHWTFGPMPAIPSLGRDEIEAITAYVRSVQREEGVE